MDAPSTSNSNESDNIAVDRHLTNRFLIGELTFAEYSEKWLGSIDENDEDYVEVDPEEFENETADQEADVENNEHTETKDSKPATGKDVKRVRRRQRQLPAALAGLMGEANLRYVRGDHTTAEKICYEIIRQTPTAYEPFQTLAQIYENNPDKALEFSLIAAHLNRDPTEWIRLANILRQKGDIKQEIFCLTKAIKADPKNISNHILRLERLQYLEKNNMVPVGCTSSIICRTALMNSYPDSEGKTVIEMAKSIASEYHINNKIHVACNIMDKAYKRFSSLFSYEDLNLYLELLLAQKQYDKCINIFVEKGNVEIELEYQTISDNDCIEEVAQVINCSIPPTLPIDLRTKLIICLIHMKCFHLIETYLNAIIENESVEDNGDIFLDIEEALTSEGQHLEALRLLTLLVNSKNFSLPAVWLKYAECLEALNKTNEAITAYETVVKFAPQHLNARIKLSTLFKGSKMFDKAYSALIQDEHIDILDTALLYERCTILKSMGYKKEYLRVGHLLLSRHFYTIRDKSETRALIFKDVYDLLKASRETRGETFEEPDPPLFEESSDKLTLEVEWELLTDLFHVAYELREYPTLQRISFLALASKRFSPYRRNLEFIAILASYYNSDPYFAFSLLRIFLITMSNKSNVWNLLALILQRGEDQRTTKFLNRFFVKKPQLGHQINILLGNYYLRAGSYRCALKEYFLSFNEKPSSLCAFLCGIALIQLASQKFAINRNTLVVQATAFFRKYEEMRSKDATHECFYNMGRAFHQLGLFNLACMYYERALKVCNDLISSKPEIFDLRREIAFNLHLIHKNNAPQVANANLFGIVRLLLPNYDRDRGPYGIKENTFAKIYIRILNLPTGGIDAQKLLNYKAPSSSTATSADFADVAYWVLKSRCKPKHENLLISNINAHLDCIAVSHANSQPRSVDNELTKLIGTLTAVQQKWLIRIILKDLKFGLSLNKILLCFHPDAPDLYDSTNSLAKICSELYDFKIKLNEIEIDVYSAYRPMLSNKLDIKNIKSVMKKDDIYFLEMKFDGERFQIHMKNGVFKYFSRNAFDYTQQFGETFDSNGTLTKHLKNLLDNSVHSFIIDGEMMGWHKSKKMFSSKGINFDVKKISDASAYQPCFCAFDILLFNDILMTNKPLYERIEYLDKLFKEEEGVFVHSKRTQTQDSKEVVQALNDAINNQEEGIVLKDIMSFYKPNSRKGGWFKIKPEYTEGVMNELDFLIIGGYFVENKRYGEIGSVLLGVADSMKNSDNEPSMFYSMGKVKLTLIKEEIEELCGKLQPHWNPVKKDTCPSSISWSKDKPDVWIEPKKSFILQIKASELVKTNAFKTEYTVRFPRIENIRYDKPWYDCLTLDEFSDLTKNSHGVEKLTGRNIGDDDIESPNTISPRKKKLFNVASQFQPTVLNDVIETSSIFSGKEFCIINGNKKMSKSDLELKVVENGGRLVQNPGKNTFCIIAGDINVRVTNAIKSGEHNIVTVDWLLNSLKEEYISSGNLLEWTPQDLIGMSMNVAEKFILKYDKFGDSFTIPTNNKLLEYSMNQVNEKTTPAQLSISELSLLDLEIFDGPSPYSFLRNCNIYLLADKCDGIELKILKIEMKLYGATLDEFICPQTSHIILYSVPNSNNICKFKDIINLHKCKAYVLSVDWISSCLQSKLLINEDDYILNIFNP